MRGIINFFRNNFSECKSVWEGLLKKEIRVGVFAIYYWGFVIIVSPFLLALFIVMAIKLRKIRKEKW